MGSAPARAALPSLDIFTKQPSQLSVSEVTEFTTFSEKCVAAHQDSDNDSVSTIHSLEPSSPEMETPKKKERVRARTPGSPTSSPGTQPVSRPTSAATSIHHSRPDSRSTARSRPPSRHSSLHSSRRAVPNPAIVQVPSSRQNPNDRRESLLALHRESCRLFQDSESTPKYSIDERRPSLHRATSTTHRNRQDFRTSSEIGSSAPPSPIASSCSSRRPWPDHRSSISATPAPLHARDRSNTLPSPNSVASRHGYSPSASSIHVPATVMEWTSDTTRRREYEKIDRASRGMRGLWRRVAPRWCQSRDARTPFFEEGKTSREGSVRRFRMDLSDDETEEAEGKPHAQLLDFLGKGASDRRRVCRQSKNSP
ncbi:hypothetical protein N7462_010017 [Penicillium macrosclerotiorum]|uniref:uncharacterized protein n=1 Tax=Penicillium macrosclerotiorum TaxID=303699 RepID=UPI002548DEDD|nr:uncharacterized protein N7462_010017 [Penicillium macrosclerotiorum]KAJ5668947.1 hypothetical protein N7462_010017 [Penicillium macrosclerotiorum]